MTALLIKNEKRIVELERRRTKASADWEEKMDRS